MRSIHTRTTLLVVALFLASCGQESTPSGDAAPQQQIPSVPVTEVKPEDITIEEAYPATLQGLEVIDIKPRVNGFIEKVYVDEGEVVKKGQPLFKIDSPTSDQALKQAEATYNTAKLDVERMRSLAEKDIISDFNLQQYENSFASAQAALDQAKASQSWTTVVSPVNGVVGTIDFRIGSLVSNADVLTTVANNSTMMAYFSMNEKELYDFLELWQGNSVSEKIKNIPPVNLKLANGSNYSEAGSIETISGVVNVNTGAVNIRAKFSNPDGFLRSGGSAQVVLNIPYDSVYVIPQEATFNLQDRVLVFKVQADSVVQKVIQVESAENGQSYLVTDGLNTGDQIVTDNIIGLRSGQKISIQ